MAGYSKNFYYTYVFIKVEHDYNAKYQFMKIKSKNQKNITEWNKYNQEEIDVIAGVG